MPSITAEEAPKLKPYMSLASQVGSFAGQIMTSGIKKVRIEYEGHVASLNTRPLTAIVLEGLLKPLLTSVNMVNAPLIAKEITMLARRMPTVLPEMSLAEALETTKIHSVGQPIAPDGLGP